MRNHLTHETTTGPLAPLGPPVLGRCLGAFSLAPASLALGQLSCSLVPYGLSTGNLLLPTVQLSWGQIPVLALKLG